MWARIVDDRHYEVSQIKKLVMAQRKLDARAHYKIMNCQDMAQTQIDIIIIDLIAGILAVYLKLSSFWKFIDKERTYLLKYIRLCLCIS